jgi:hypothetical protein
MDWLDVLWAGFAVAYGWVSIERPGKIYSDFKKYWAVNQKKLNPKNGRMKRFQV